MITCAIVMCSRTQVINGTIHPFCAEHILDFQLSPEGRNRTPTSLTDFRDRLWKEDCAARATQKWESASPEQRAEWAKGGFGR